MYGSNERLLSVGDVDGAGAGLGGLVGWFGSSIMLDA